MKYCIKCNTELTDESKYCNECGKNQLTDENDNQDSYDEQDVKDDNYTREPVYTAKPVYKENSDYQDVNNFHPKRKHSPILILCLTVIIVGGVALGLWSTNKDKSVLIKRSTSTVIKTEPAESTKVSGLNQKVTIEDSLYGTYEVTINSISKTEERNKINTIVPAEVYKINYTYKLLSKGSATHGLYISNFNSFDSTGEAGDFYSNKIESYPKILTILGSRCSADIFIAVKNKSTFLNLVLDYYTKNESRYITFKIPTK